MKEAKKYTILETEPYAHHQMNKWQLSRRVRSNMSRRKECGFFISLFRPPSSPHCIPCGYDRHHHRPSAPSKKEKKKREIRDGTNVISAVDGLERKDFENMHVENKNGMFEKRLSLTTCREELQKIFKGSIKKRFLTFFDL